MNDKVTKNNVKVLGLQCEARALRQTRVIRCIINHKIKTMKLEIKHLAPYLPYGIRVRVDYYTQHEGRIFNFSPTILLDFFRDEYIVKPILRPLSDLTEEIEINGGKFIPKNKLIEMFDYISFDYRAFESDLFLNMPYNLVEKLFEWHFDVFDLIKKGLAIDVNTLSE